MQILWPWVLSPYHLKTGPHSSRNFTCPGPPCLRVDCGLSCFYTWLLTGKRDRRTNDLMQCVTCSQREAVDMHNVGHVVWLGLMPPPHGRSSTAGAVCIHQARSRLSAVSLSIWQHRESSFVSAGPSDRRRYANSQSFCEIICDTCLRRVTRWLA